jgi:hypothetical protein
LSAELENALPKGGHKCVHTHVDFAVLSAEFENYLQKAEYV